jgi:hypothetical protein
MKNSLMAGASRFAHFAGLSRASTRAADDEDDKQGRRAEDENGGDSADGNDDGDDEPKGKKGKRGKADDDDGGKDASDNDDAGDDEPKGKRGKAEENDDDTSAEDDDEDEMKGKSSAASARRREQARISHILGHKAAANNPLLAVSLACTTRMTRKEAVAVLQQQPARADQDDGGNRHARRDRQDRNARLGGDAPAPSGKQAIAASWGAAFEKVGVKAR